MAPKAKYYETLANTMIKNFEKRRMEAYYCPTAKEAVEKALSFLPSGAVVAHGGSMTLEETGHDGCTAFSRYSVFRPGCL